MTDGMGPSYAEIQARYQDILNARSIPDRRLQRTDRRPIPVTARVVWARDGIELIDTLAWDWVGRDVRVAMSDLRRDTGGVWLDASDVTRREWSAEEKRLRGIG